MQGVASHLLVHVSFVHVVLLFPAASLMIHRACSEKGCRDRRRFRPGAVVVTMVCSVWCVVCGVWCVVCGVWCVVCSVCWSSASSKRTSARHCLFRRMSGGIDRMHPDSRRRLLFSAASSRCV